MSGRWFFRMTWVPLGILALSLASCGKPKTAPPPPVPKMDLVFTDSPTMNRDHDGNPLSVVVRLFELKDKTEFSKLTFDRVSSGLSDQEMLGQDFLAKSEFVVVPGVPHTSREDMAPGTKYVGVVAYYRRPDPNYWRFLVSVDNMRPPVPKDPAEAKKQAKRYKKNPKPNPWLSFKVEDCYLAMPDIKFEPIPGQPEMAKPMCGGAPVTPVTPEEHPAAKPGRKPAKPVQPAS